MHMHTQGASRHYFQKGDETSKVNFKEGNKGWHKKNRTQDRDGQVIGLGDAVTELGRYASLSPTLSQRLHIYNFCFAQFCSKH